MFKIIMGLHVVLCSGNIKVSLYARVEGEEVPGGHAPTDEHKKRLDSIIPYRSLDQ